MRPAGGIYHVLLGDLTMLGLVHGHELTQGAHSLVMLGL
jgi:hypothetical protein